MRQHHYQVQKGSASFMLLVFLLFAATIAGLSWVGMGIVAKDQWPIRWLEVNGSFQRVSAEQLRTRLAPMVSSSYFTVDLQALRDAANGFDWVSSVSIQKQWPDTVIVQVYEYSPVAHWNGSALISEQGEAFEVPGGDDIQGLPWLNGPEARLDDVLHHWADYARHLQPMGLYIHRLVMDERGSLSLVLNNDTLIELGREHADERMERLLKSWPKLAGGEQGVPLKVDLRYANGFAVSWRTEEEQLAGNDI